MNLNKWNNITLAIIAITIMASLCVHINQTQQTARETLLNKQKQYDNCRFELMDKNEKQQYTILSEGQTLPDNLKLKENVCILRLHDGACLGCYAENIIRLFNILEAEKMEIFILGSYSTQKQFQAELSGITELNATNSLNIRGLTCLPADSLDCPYLFSITNNKSRNVFIFEKGNFDMIYEYIQMLKRTNDR